MQAIRNMRNKHGTRLRVTRHIVLKNMWEYYVTDDRFDADTVRCLVVGFETELGDVYLPEIKPYIISDTKSEGLPEGLMAAPGWEWVS